MKNQVLPIIAFLIFSISAVAQTFSSDHLSRFSEQDRVLGIHENLAQKTIEMEAVSKEIAEGKEAMTINESIIDSVIYYQYETDSDSVLITKFEYDFHESGLAQIRYEYAWDEENTQWIFLKKRDYTYDEAELPISLDTYIWDVDLNVWVNDRMTNWEFNEDGDEVYYEHSRWNVELDRWDKYYKVITTYNENREILVETVWEGDEQNEWLIYFVYEATFNEENLLMTVVLSFSDLDESGLAFYKKDELIYTSSSIHESTLYYDWNNDVWDLRNKDDFYYTETGKIDSVFCYQRFEGDWTPLRKQNFDYDENDNEILFERFDWDGNQLINDSKTVHTYDSNNNEISRIVSDWSLDNNDWLYHYKNEFIYNENSIQIMYSYYHWDIDLDIWVGNLKNAYVLDEEDQNRIKIYYKWDESIVDWVFDEKGFYYRTATSGLIEFSDNNLIIYPNPAKSILSIKRENTEPVKCYIISINGQKLIEFDLFGFNTAINIENLSEGLYLLQINNGDNTITTKFLKQ